MVTTPQQPDISVIVPARNEEASLAACLSSLVGQAGPTCEIIVVDDHSTDRTREIAESFSVQVIGAGLLPEGWSGKCNACWSGAKAARGRWLLFTDADTLHENDSIAQGLTEAEGTGAAMLSYSPRQEVHSFAERALMPVIFAELATTFRPREVSDPTSPTAAANGQYILIRRDAYYAVGGHASVANAILEDVDLARRVKQVGYRLQFHQSDAVSTRMYRSFGAMWEGWTKNLALLFSHPLRLAMKRKLECVTIVVSIVGVVVSIYRHSPMGIAISSGVAAMMLGYYWQRIRRAHFDWLSNVLGIFGLPLFSILLVNSYISHRSSKVRWKGRVYEGNR
jgi:glycosyltransferase involved in cell wall biosynthesis